MSKKTKKSVKRSQKAKIGSQLVMREKKALQFRSAGRTTLAKGRITRHEETLVQHESSQPVALSNNARRAKRQQSVRRLKTPERDKPPVQFVQPVATVSIPKDSPETPTTRPVSTIATSKSNHSHSETKRAQPTEPQPTIRPRRVVFQMLVICLVSIAATINIANYGPLIPILQPALNIDEGQVGLFSAVLFGGIVLANLPGGVLADRLGARTVLLGGLILITGGALLFPVFPNFYWMLICRGLVGLGMGSALVSCSLACAQLGKYEPLAQGLNGGTAQLGAGLGLFLMPQLLKVLDWRGSLLACALPGIIALILCFWFPKKEKLASSVELPRENPALAIRTPAIWVTGLAHIGTFGLADAVMTWISVYFIMQYSTTLEFAGILGGLALFAGVVIQPLGGLLLARFQRPVLLIRIGTIMALLSVVALAFPGRIFPVAILGLVLFAIGTTLPYASIFSMAAAAGRVSGAGAGISQGLVAMQASLAAIAGAPLIGVVLERTDNIALAIGSIAIIFPLIAVTASLFLKQVRKPRPQTSHMPEHSIVHPNEVVYTR